MNMTPFIAEFIGTFLLIAVGASVNANVVLAKTKGHQSGWTIITVGWGIAVFLGVYVSTTLGGSGHLNPAVTIGLTAFELFDSSLTMGYIIAQLTGAFLGAIAAWLAFWIHFKDTMDSDAILAVFSTSPAIRHTPSNLMTEIIATFVLVFGALCASAPESSLGALDALPVALLVVGIGMGLGGPTGYAINPARDLGPRIAHQLLPIPHKKGSDWSYSWIPIFGPIVGSLTASWIFQICT